MNYEIFVNARNIGYIVVYLFIVSCSNNHKTTKKSDLDLVFENFFKEALTLSYIEYCNQDDTKCESQVNKHILKCFNNLNFNVVQLYDISKTNTLLRQNLTINDDKPERTNIHSRKLDNCITNKISGYFVHNIKNEFKKINLSEPNLNNSETNIVVEINNKNEIFVNSRKVDINNLQNLTDKLSTLNPNINAIIIGHKEALVSVFTSVLDQIRSSNIDNISLMTSEN